MIYGKRWKGDKTHVVAMRIDHFMNLVMWRREYSRVSAGGNGINFVWKDKAGNMYSSFASGQNGEITRVYRISSRKAVRVA